MKKILIIEDEQLLREMYSKKFEAEGLIVFNTDSVKSALKIVQTEQPDIILLDVLLPKENGLSFLKQLKRKAKKFPPRVIVFSNFDNPATRSKATSLGVLAYLLKTNYTPAEIVAKVKSYLN